MNYKNTQKCPLDLLKKRAFLLSQIREYFKNENVLEVETPILSSSGNTDIHINSHTSESIRSDFNCSYLRTSPEFPLKRLLSQGSGDIFEIGKVFRKGEVSSTHNPEFTMLEWYRLGFSYLDLIDDVCSLVSYICSKLDLISPNKHIIEFKTCFQKYLGIDLDHIGLTEINQKCQEFNYSGSKLTKDEALDYLFATQIQPSLDKSVLTFVTLYPASQAALSQINPQDPTTSLRFEAFYKGHEIGNGYQELTESDVLLQRFKEDNQYRKTHNLPEINIDYKLIDSMKNMPDCSGIAIGVDRLYMTLYEPLTIDEILIFNVSNA